MLITYITISSQNIRPTIAYWTIKLHETGRAAIGSLVPNCLSSYSQIAPNSLSSYSQIAPNCLSSYSQIAPNSLSSCSQIAPNCLSSYSQIAPNCLSSYSQIAPNCLSSYSQIAPNCLSSYSQIAPNCLSNYSQNLFSLEEPLKYFFLSRGTPNCENGNIPNKQFVSHGDYCSVDNLQKEMPAIFRVIYFNIFFYFNECTVHFYCHVK
jgi:hypothetical protein